MAKTVLTKKLRPQSIYYKIFYSPDERRRELREIKHWTPTDGPIYFYKDFANDMAVAEEILLDTKKYSDISFQLNNNTSNNFRLYIEMRNRFKG